MAFIEYIFDDERRQIEITDGDERKPIVVLLHGTGGTINDMTNPGESPDSNYDFTSPFPPDVPIGWRAYPGVGIWFCCGLDSKKDVRSWRDVLVSFKFRTAAYAQVDPTGFLERPVRELAVVMRTLTQAFPNGKFVLLSHSRGGLLTRKFLKDNGPLAERICTVITLHSPHTGSALATIAATLRNLIEGLSDIFGDIVLDVLGWLLDMADSDAYQEMAIGSDFLTELADDESAFPGIDYYTFGGISVRLTRIHSWNFTVGSAVPQWHWPPFFHERTMIQVPGISPIADSLPNLIDELSDGIGDLLTADHRTRLPFATHQTNRINHAEALWDPILQAQVLRILGEDVPIGDPPIEEPSFWS
jgi:hypothetical protein